MKRLISPRIRPAQLRAARALLDWSRSQCGKIVGISAETIKNIEQGKFTPSPSTVDKILKCFSAYDVEFFMQYGVAIKENSSTPPSDSTPPETILTESKAVH